MLSIIIPTLDAGRSLPGMLAALAEARMAAPSHEIIVSDGGSRDATVELARTAGARVVEGASGRGAQLAAGAGAARGDWLLFLHADTRPQPGWTEALRRYCGSNDNGERAAYFRFALDDRHAIARLIAAAVNLRCRLFALPYGDQGLLMTRAFYQTLGGFRALPLMEDVEMVRRIGRRRLVSLDHFAVTSAARYRRDGWLLRPARNILCLALYFAGVDPARIARIYR